MGRRRRRRDLICGTAGLSPTEVLYCIVESGRGERNGRFVVVSFLVSPQTNQVGGDSFFLMYTYRRRMLNKIQAPTKKATKDAKGGRVVLVQCYSVYYLRTEYP